MHVKTGAWIVFSDHSLDRKEDHNQFSSRGSRDYQTPTYMAPVYHAPAQIYQAPVPVYQAPAPVYQAPAPMYHAQAPPPTYISIPAPHHPFKPDLDLTPILLSILPLFLLAGTLLGYAVSSGN
jgi:hypothetical protein